MCKQMWMGAFTICDLCIHGDVAHSFQINFDRSNVVQTTNTQIEFAFDGVCVCAWHFIEIASHALLSTRRIPMHALPIHPHEIKTIDTSIIILRKSVVW